ncbi:hypothetical protein [Amycolatopsis sp. cmx-11-12]
MSDEEGAAESSRPNAGAGPTGSSATPAEIHEGESHAMRLAEEEPDVGEK